MSKRADMELVRAYFRVTIDNHPEFTAPDVWRAMVAQHGKLCTLRTAQTIYNTFKRAKRPDPAPWYRRKSVRSPMFRRRGFWRRLALILRRWNL